QYFKPYPSSLTHRSEKIRTYNFKENRVTDHRIGLTIHQLDQVMDGSLDAIVEALTTYYQAEKLKGESLTPVGVYLILFRKAALIRLFHTILTLTSRAEINF